MKASTSIVEVWIKVNGFKGTWILYDRPASRQRAEAIVNARRSRDKDYDYQIREVRAK